MFNGLLGPGVLSPAMALRRFIAADALEAGGVDLERLRLVLPRVDPHKVVVRESKFLLRMVYGPRIAAAAMVWGIHVKPAVMDRHVAGLEQTRTAHLMVHELTHVEQVRRHGLIGQSSRYIADYVRARLRGRSNWEAYRGVGFEVEARRTAELVMSMSAPT